MACGQNPAAWLSSLEKAGLGANPDVALGSGQVEIAKGSLMWQQPFREGKNA